MSEERGHWGSKIGFVLAAAGSAVGLGNLWRFPYVTGENGGGAFVLVYLACIALVGLPVMSAEVLIGRMAQSSPVGAFRGLSRPGSPWISVGWLGVLTGFVILSYYSVVAGWALHFLYLSLSGAIGGVEIEVVGGYFARLHGDAGLNVLWHGLFMVLTVGVVLGGVQRGVERAARILMPALFLMLVALMLYGTTLPGFAEAVDFVFGFHRGELTASGILEALGHSFFTLSVGMGAMLTYGSYLDRGDDIVASSLAITVLDTLVALLACLVLFPITFSYGMEPGQGPGLVFTNMPIAFAQLPGGDILSVVFFVLVIFAALTSAISLLEVVAAYFIDERGWSRKRAVTVWGGVLFAVGIPSALSASTELFGAPFLGVFEKSFFDLAADFSSNVMLPVSGLGVALFMAFRVSEQARAAAIATGSTLGSVRGLYLGWLYALRFVVPIAIVFVMLNALGVIG